MRADSLLVLAALAGVCCAQDPQPTAVEQKKPTPVDAEVVNAAMLAFFDKTDWNTSDWRSGDFVVVRPAWTSTRRPSFDSELNSAIEWSGSYKKGEADLKKLEGIKGSIRRDGTAFDPGKLPELKDLQFDERIVVRDLDRPLFDEPKVKNRAGKEGTIRTICSVSPPAFSHDGRYASVSMGVPWSIHHADLTFFLERTTKSWKVVHVKVLYFF